MKIKTEATHTIELSDEEAFDLCVTLYQVQQLNKNMPSQHIQFDSTTSDLMYMLQALPIPASREEL